MKHRLRVCTKVYPSCPSDNISINMDVLASCFGGLALLLVIKTRMYDVISHSLMYSESWIILSHDSNTPLTGCWTFVFDIEPDGAHKFVVGSTVMFGGVVPMVVLT